jgi:Icc-related predicted phosphoesterase
MKILCISDMVDPFIYNTSIKEQFADVSIILAAGDLPMDYIDFVVSTLNKPTYFVFGNHDLKEYKYYHHEVGTTSPLINASIGVSSQRGHGAIYAGFKVFQDKNLLITDSITGKQRPLLIAGTDGSIDYNHGLAQFTNTQMKHKLHAMAPQLLYNKIKYGRYLDIFLTHAPPRHVHDHEDPCHQGFECFNDFIKKYQPQYMIHGHIHLYDMQEERVSIVDKTTVANAYGHHIIEI